MVRFAPGEAALELRDSTRIFLAVLLIGNRLVVIPFHYARGCAGDEPHVGDRHLAVRAPRHLELHDDRVLVPRVEVPAEGPIAHTVKYVVSVIELDGLQCMGMRAVDHVRARVDGRVALGELRAVHVVAALVAPVQRRDDKLRALLPERRDAGLYLGDCAKRHGVHAYLQARLGLVDTVLVPARVAYARGVPAWPWYPRSPARRNPEHGYCPA